MSKIKGLGTAEKPWELNTPPGTADYQAYKDAAVDPPALVVQVGKTQLRYHLRAIEDLHAMLTKKGDWVRRQIARLPLRRLKSTITTATTSRTWRNPPRVYALTRPRTQSTNKMTAIVHSMIAS
jgi:hypothetical protein